MAVQSALQELVDTLNRLAIPYMVGGSLASSLHGIFRSTNDVDIVAAVREEHIAPLVSGLAGTFYADAETMREALQQGRPFNLIHFLSGYKFDIFPAAGDPYFETQLSRSKIQQVALGEGEAIGCSVATAEDTILAKLAWYRAGGEQSDRQWNDVLGICSVQGTLLDRTYMRKWAAYLKVNDLLDRLLPDKEPA
ncbi:MAG: hypothetical protein WBE37_28675 [Bryobacteraceae bacterium]